MTKKYEIGLLVSRPFLLIQEDGFEPGAIGHILTFGETHAEEQQKYPIIGLGSVARVDLGRRGVPELWSGSGGRWLEVDWFGGDWLDRCRFLGVRRR